MALIKDIAFVPVVGGYFNIDLGAMQQDRARDGFLYSGPAVTPGFERPVEPGAALSVLLRLTDGQVAMGEGASVILAGVAGREPMFRPAEALEMLDRHVRPLLQGRDVARARLLAEELDAAKVDGQPLHAAIRYAVTQAIFHAAALARGLTIAEIIADEYGAELSPGPIPLLASAEQDDALLIDRAILKGVDLLPHGGFSSVERDLGNDGSKLCRYAANLSARIRAISDPAYRPTLHFDMYGSVGTLFPDEQRLAEYLDEVARAAAPFPLLIESPIIKPDQAQQFASYARLKAALDARNSPVRIIIDEWCNTLEDIRTCARLGVAHLAQVKTPDLGGINNAIEAVQACRQAGVGVCLGGSANETDLSARITAQVGIACRPDFLMVKPGLGFDEGFMIQRNEMLRTLALIGNRKAHQSESGTGG